MISPNNVYFSSTAIDNDQPSPAPNLPNSFAPPDFLDDFLMNLDLLDPDNIDTPLFDNGEIDDLFDGLIKGQVAGLSSGLIEDQAQAVIVNEELPNLLEQSSVSSEDGIVNNQSKVTDTTQTGSDLVKASDLYARSNFINSTFLYPTGQSLMLFTSPYSYQRALYEETDLGKDLRYISTPVNNYIDFGLLELRNHIHPTTSVIMRVTRTTTPYGRDGIVCCHPYSLWVKDKHANIHYGSLLLDITEKIRNKQPIKFKNLIMPRLKQDQLKKITQWPIYSSNQLDCN
ncbi:unnamed protein product, partial [Rotaria sp. Silwood2]